MLESVDLALSLSKSAFKEVMRGQQDRLADLADLCFEKKAPVVVVFEGWDASGKGTIIRRLTQRLDPRGFKVLPTRAPMPHEQDKPWLWRFWMHIPRHGQIAIFDRSWYGRVLVERVEGLTAIPDWIRAYEEINAFERTLAADGTVFLKFFLHISKEEQLRRFVMLTGQPETAWQVTADDWEHHRRYDEYVRAVEDMLSNTSTPELAPWDVVPATNREYCHYHIFRTVIRRLEVALGVEPGPEPVLELLEVEAERDKVAKREKNLAKKLAKAEAKSAARVESKAEAKAKTAAKSTKKAAKALAKAETAKPAESKVKPARVKTAKVHEKAEAAKLKKTMAEQARQEKSKTETAKQGKAKVKAKDESKSISKAAKGGSKAKGGADAAGNGRFAPDSLILDTDAEEDGNA